MDAARARLCKAMDVAIAWLAQSYSIPGALVAVKAPLPATEDYDIVRADFVDRLFEAFMGYVSTEGGGARRYMNAARRAVNEDHPAAFYGGYAEAGGEDTEDEDEKWLTARVAEQLGFLAGTFETLKELRDTQTVTEDRVTAIVDGWAAGLDSTYSEGKLRGAKNVMLTFDGDDGKESCAQCQRYKGKRHSARWWLDHDLVRRNGNENFDCGRWAPCQHNLYTDDGEEYTR